MNIDSENYVATGYGHDDLGIANPIAPIPCFIILLEVGAERKVTVLGMCMSKDMTSIIPRALTIF